MSTRAAKTSSKAGQRGGKKVAVPAKGPPQPAAPDAAEPSANGTFPVAGIGASAGGLEAFTALLKALPNDTGMAFVLVQHMDPAHDSALSQILSRATGMLVEEVTDGIAVKPNRVYVIPSNADMTIRGGILRLAQRQEVAGRHLPIDRFLASLAEDRKSAAIGIILSGTASDGTSGLRSIKAEGGLTFAQDERSARHPGMPMSAVAAGCVDFVLPPQKIAAELARLGRYPYVGIVQPGGPGELPEGADGLRNICHLLRSTTGVDFLLYKPATIRRRIARRMLLHRVQDTDKYLQLLRKSPAEVDALYQDILVHVTGFFRDAEAFQVLETSVLPGIIARKPAGQPIRAWVPGCSTGEEVYSIAMLLLEALGDRSGQTRVQVFGTDISEPALQQARSGIYTEASLANVSRARLRKFFVKSEGGYQINKPMRQMCVFARHDLTRDPPFSNLDLVSCRNVLIYMGAALQKRVVEIFHYALRQDGCLFLGKSESLSAHANLFTLGDRKHKIFSRNPVPTPHFDMAPDRPQQGTRGPMVAAPAAVTFDLKKAAERFLLDRFAPAAIVVGPDLHIVHFQGDTSPYLAPVSGEPSFHLLRILRPELVVEVRAAIQKVKKAGAAALTEAIRLKHNGHAKTIRLEVVPLEGRRAGGHDFLVLFRQEPAPPVPAAAPAGESASAKRGAQESRQEAVRLERELALARDSLRSLVEDHETTYEELKAANEEVLSANEELQSTNEELETAKEELQSSNEELTTLYEELQNRNAELGQLANDLSNLLVGVNIPVVIIDHGLQIRRFTPAAGKVLNLIATDVGRPFSHIASNLTVADWDPLFSEVLDQLHTVERDVQDRQGHWYTLRMRPYQTGDNRIDGVLMALMDIDVVKQSLEQARQARDYSKAIVETISSPLLVLDRETRVMTANAAFCQAFRMSAEETLGKPIFELGEGQWNIPRLRQLLTDLLLQDARIDNLPVENEFPAVGYRHLLVNARQIHFAGVGTGLVLLAIEDVTTALEARRQIEESESVTRALMETASQAILAMDRNGTIRLVNLMTETMFGYRRDELLGRPLGILLPERFQKRHAAHGAGFFAAPRNRPMGLGLDLLGRRKDGTEFPVEVSLSHIETKESMLAVCFVSDITERKLNEAARLLYQQELHDFTARLISAQEANRKHLARELHDVFSQKLAILGMEISTLQRQPESHDAAGGRLRQIADQISGLAKDIHDMSRQLHPAILDDLGLAAALNGECLAFSEQHGIPVEFTPRNVAEPLSEEVSLCLYRVAQESLRNIAKHSGAAEVRVSLTGGDEEIALVIEDSGGGFEREDVRGKGHLGLVSMDERVRLVNGTFSIRSEAGKGTRVEARVPLPGREP